MISKLPSNTFNSMPAPAFCKFTEWRFAPQMSVGIVTVSFLVCLFVWFFLPNPYQTDWKLKMILKKTENCKSSKSRNGRWPHRKHKNCNRCTSRCNTIHRSSVSGLSSYTDIILSLNSICPPFPSVLSFLQLLFLSRPQWQTESKGCRGGGGVSSPWKQSTFNQASVSVLSSPPLFSLLTESKRDVHLFLSTRVAWQWVE